MKFRRGKQFTVPQCADIILVHTPPNSPRPPLLAQEAGTSNAADQESSEEEVEQPQMSVPVSFGLLVVVTVVSLLRLAVCVFHTEGYC